MNRKEVYRHFCTEHNVPIYLHSDWLDTVVQGSEDWDVFFSFDKSGRIQAYFPFVFKKQGFWNKITMPLFTPYMGPRILYPDGLTEYEKRSLENQILEGLISELNGFDDIRIKWDRAYDNALPFYWQSFRIEISYTYCINNTSDLNVLFFHFKKSIQRQIHKASSQLIVKENTEIDNVLDMLEKSLGYRVNHSLMRKLHELVKRYNRYHILEAIDSKGKVIGAIYLVFDQHELLYLYGGYDDKYNNSGAMPLLFWQALQLAHQKSLTFNFEGSMLKGVERFFRSFGGQLSPVYSLKRIKFPFNFIDWMRNRKYP
ncbi:MAG: aminoacyltransferase [Chitinophagales bacterium]|nr:aminoacyltransferase [Chitinophagales bacterium]